MATGAPFHVPFLILKSLMKLHFNGNSTLIEYITQLREGNLNGWLHVAVFIVVYSMFNQQPTNAFIPAPKPGVSIGWNGANV